MSGTPLVRGSRVGPWTLVDRLYKSSGRETWSAEEDGFDPGVIRIGTDVSRDDLVVESELLASLEEENVVGLGQVGFEDFPPWFELKWPKGDVVRKHIRTRPMKVKAALEACRDLAGLMARLHAHGVFRPDLRASAVVIAETGPVVTDWGRAYRAGPSSLPGIEPPPQRDIGALGVLLYAMLTRERGEAADGLDPGEGFSDAVRELVKDLTGSVIERPRTARELSYRIRGLLNEPDLLVDPLVKVEFTPRENMMRGASKQSQSPGRSSAVGVVQVGTAAEPIMLGGGLLVGAFALVALIVAGGLFLWAVVL